MKRVVILIAVGIFAVCMAAGLKNSAKTGADPDQKPAEIKIDPGVFDDYVGQYAFAENPDLVFSVFREGENYFIQVSSQGRIQIYPASTSKFFAKILDGDATFVRDASGKVVALVWRQGDRSARARKKTDKPHARIKEKVIIFEAQRRRRVCA